MSRSFACILVVLLAACGDGSPAQPSSPEAVLAQTVSLEGEAGSGDGHVVQRSGASSGGTIHLGPGERRQWTFSLTAREVQYALLVTYSNGHFGDSEVISVAIDGIAVGSFQARDTGGDDDEGWNVFVTDSPGAARLRSGSHTLVLEVRGGDGCVEIDVVRLSPPSA